MLTGGWQDLYAELSEQCKKYACDLLEQCRSSEEVIAVLNKSKYSSSSTSDDDEEDSYEGGVDEPVDEREFEEIEDDVDSPDYDDDDDDDDDDSAAEKLTLDRFKLALKYEQKQVTRVLLFTHADNSSRSKAFIRICLCVSLLVRRITQKRMIQNLQI